MNAKQEIGSPLGRRFSLKVQKLGVKIREGSLRKTLFAFQHPRYDMIPEAHFHVVKHFPEDNS